MQWSLWKLPLPVRWLPVRWMMGRILTRRFAWNIPRGKRVRQRVGLLVLLLLLALGSGGCDLISRDPPAPTPMPYLDPAQLDRNLPHQVLILAVVCLANGAAYASLLQQQALSLVAASVQGLARVNADGAVVWVNWADAHPFAPRNAVDVLTIPPTPALPTPPALTPTPTVSPQNPYASAAAQGAIDKANQAAEQQYETRLTQVQGQLAAVTAKVGAWTTALQTLPPPRAEGAPDLSACVAMASQRLNNWPGATRYLVVAGPLSPPSGQVSWYSLAGVHVRFIDTSCPDVQRCIAGENAWGRAFAASGVTDQLYFDPGESAALPTVLTTRPNSQP